MWAGSGARSRGARGPPALVVAVLWRRRLAQMLGRDAPIQIVLCRKRVAGLLADRVGVASRRRPDSLVLEQPLHGLAGLASPSKLGLQLENVSAQVESEQHVI